MPGRIKSLPRGIKSRSVNRVLNMRIGESDMAQTPPLLIPMEDTPSMLRTTLQPSKSRHLRLGEILIESGLLNQEQVDHALEVQRESHQHIGHVLASLGFLSDDQ